MALSSNIIWEIRPGLGNANNGGGFNPVTGTNDFSVQDAAQDSGVNLTVDAVTNTDVAPDGYVPSAIDVGNIINITTGAPWTAGRYEIASIEAGKWRLDRSPAVAGTAGGAWFLGGAVASLATIATTIVPGNLVYCKYTGTTDAMGNVAVTITATGTFETPIIIEGYNTSRGDLIAETWEESHNPAGFLYGPNASSGHQYPTLTTAGANGVLSSTAYTFWRCLKITGDRNNSIFVTGTGAQLFRVISAHVQTAASAAAICTLGGNSNAFYDSEFVTLTSTGITTLQLDQSSAYLCRFASVGGTGINAYGAKSIDSCFFYNCNNNVMSGISLKTQNVVHSIKSCTFDSCYYAISYNNVAAGSGLIPILESNQATNNSNGFFANLRLVTNIAISSIRNRIRDNGANNYSTINSRTPAIGDITTSQTDAEEYETLHSGSCQDGGNTTTVVFSPDASSTNDYYRGCKVRISKSSESDATGYVYSYVGSTRTATLLKAWTPSPDSTWTYRIQTSRLTNDAAGRQAIAENTDTGWLQGDAPSLPSDEQIAEAVWNYGERALTQCQ